MDVIYLNSRHRFAMSDGYAFDMSTLTVTMPTVRERWAIRKSKRNLIPVLIPAFFQRDMPLSNLYIGRDYTVTFVEGRGAGKGVQKKALQIVEKSGSYRAVVTGVSPRLVGSVVVPFQVERRPLAPLLVFLLIVVVAVVVGVALL